MSSKFKGGTGQFLLQALFYETTLADKSTVVYTLKEHDHEGYPSLHRLYMEYGDLTEYNFAKGCLAGWSHWLRLQECTWFKPYIEAWRAELEVRLRARALLNIITLSDVKHPSSFQANKYLLEGAWKPADALKRGRPTKAAIQAEASLQASEARRIEDDYNRLKEKAN
jgi:hypothetical protein